MPWLETDVRDQRIRFVIAANHPTASVTATCRAFGISRKTGYKWLGRAEASESVSELGDRSRRKASRSRLGQSIASSRARD